MARKSRAEAADEGKLDLTPMIDLVFNLIIFFMVVSELSNLSVEQLALPYADKAQDVKPKPGAPTEKILQANVMPTGMIKVKGLAFSDDPEIQQKTKDQLPSFNEFLRIEAAGAEREPPDPSNPNLSPSKLRINIRADKEVAFKYVQQVFEACSKNGVYRTSLAATKENPQQ